LNGETFEVECATLDEMLVDRDRRISFIKCDIEGHEVNALKGAFDVLRNDTPTVLVETTARNLLAIMEFVAPLGYTPLQCNDNGTLVPLRVSSVGAFNCFLVPGNIGIPDLNVLGANQAPSFTKKATKLSSRIQIVSCSIHERSRAIAQQSTKPDGL